ncbi:nucleotide sugar dehydrogenase [Oleidesulfovibrio alaskensis]|jgi:UDP-N-acetyl-D-galactosamine dehydrogenase|uniref:nucleotide sugar dehydrogenase n=1 Tax=Oleidesulfovibrio alaskensis TaxID=58180 RepID=UPI001A5C10AB|nr:nucleotide sugar dehydrogenase [Oleidesulfovibrio alaskensis]MBL3581496.1 nucleotide sugar dehydrogenase [Oleidesulfovibrio alaskensis]
MIRFEELTDANAAVAVVGLGYVGLPLAVALSEHFRVIGFDISQRRVDALIKGEDATGEVENSRLAACKAEFTADPARIGQADIVIVAVPTPIDGNRRPDLFPVESASRTVGRTMKKGCVVVYESTVYPGLTEEICVPILEKESGMKFGTDFTVGYSPERINPGDKVHTLETIVKVVSGSDEATADLLQRMYGTVVTAGTFRASSIRVAEAAKVIENTQRDLNIALMNELALLFDRMDIDTLEVLEAAGTKWNFLPFRPGLVGGHCIGVDPYYLTFKAEALGHHPQVILAGRRINDGMGKFVAETCVKKMIRKGNVVAGSRVGVLGLTFKENVPDLRNTRVVDVIDELRDYGVHVLVHDPQADPAEAHEEYGLTLTGLDTLRELDAVILAVPHAEYDALQAQDIRGWFRDPQKALLLDIKGAKSPSAFTDAGFDYWRL